MFNTSFYTPNTTASKEQAEQRLISLGYKNFTFNSVSRSNGASFYFTSENGGTIRVSDHMLTGKRAFDTIQVALYEVKTLPNPNQLRTQYLSGEITLKEYRKTCKEKGFICRP